MFITYVQLCKVITFFTQETLLSKGTNSVLKLSDVDLRSSEADYKQRRGRLERHPGKRCYLLLIIHVDEDSGQLKKIVQWVSSKPFILISTNVMVLLTKSQDGDYVILFPDSI